MIDRNLNKIFFGLAIFIFLGYFSPLLSQKLNTENDKEALKNIYKTALKSSQSYPWLKDLSLDIGGRLSGSPEAARAVEMMKSIMDTMPFDRVYLQEVQVPHWKRGEKEIVKLNTKSENTINLNNLAIGNSVGTGKDGIEADVLEVQSLDTFSKMTPDKIKGKIVFYNRPMDSLLINTFHAYGGAVDQRVYGASEAARYGAKAVIVRSLTTKTDDVVHTGTLLYREEDPKIPAFTISTSDAEKLSGLISDNSLKSVYVRSTCKMIDTVKSHNVIGEIKGSQYPEEIILVGGHLDAWDVGHGAHDDGAGCVHSLDVVHLLNILNYTPKRTLRVVLFMNEENGSAGAIKYNEESDENNEFHLAAIESDAGGFTPRGFGFDAHQDVKKEHLTKVRSWQKLFTPYDISLRFGGSGADIYRLKSQKGILSGLRPDPQRYFDLHHSSEDTFDKINARELKLGSAAMTSLVYLLDKHGL